MKRNKIQATFLRGGVQTYRPPKGIDKQVITAGTPTHPIQTGIAVVERMEGGSELGCAGSAPDPRILLRIAPQTKLNDDCIIGSRGPGTNEGDFLLMPHLAEVHPGRFRGWVCELIAGYKCN